MIQRVRLGPPACGSCGYNTTGLTTFTCPECGADLRVAGITRGRGGEARAGFAVSALLLIPAWFMCGLILATAVSALVPHRQHLQRDVRLTGARSGAYRGIDVAARGEGWEGERPAMRVELRMVPLAAAPSAGGTGTMPSPPPAAFPVTTTTTADAVAAWMAGAGLDANDPRIQDEARAALMHALQNLRRRERFGSGGFGSTSLIGGGSGPFTNVSTTVRVTTDWPRAPRLLFAAVWLAVGAAAVVFLWRATRRPHPS